MNTNIKINEIKLRAEESVDRHSVINQPKLGEELRNIMDACLDGLPFGKSYHFRIAIGHRLDYFLDNRSDDEYVHEIKRIILALRDLKLQMISESDFLKIINKSKGAGNIVEFVAQGLNGTVSASFLAGMIGNF